MSNRKQISTLWMTIALALVAMTPFAAHAASSDIVSVNITSGDLSFSPNVPSNGVTVSITGGRGFVDFQRAFRGSQRASIALRDLLGERQTQLPDGTYNWEAVVTPRGVTAVFDPTVGRGKAEIEAFEKSGNRLITADEALNEPRLLERRALVQSGVFTVRSGTIVDSTAREAGGGETESTDAGLKVITKPGSGK